MLYIVSTPIGNLEDISLRALRTLKEVDLIAAEDTRHSRKLLDHYDIQTPLTSFHEHNKAHKSQELIRKMEQGLSVALISDAGTPGISDPGFVLIREARIANVQITTIPGACAAISALVLSGFAVDRFLFVGFLAPKSGKKENQLKELAQSTQTVICYESPHKLVRTIEALYNVFGDIPLCIARELTKMHEDVQRKKLSQWLEHYRTHKPKGEMVLVFDPRDRQDIQCESIQTDQS